MLRYMKICLDKDEDQDDSLTFLTIFYKSIRQNQEELMKQASKFNTYQTMKAENIKKSFNLHFHPNFTHFVNKT